MKKYLQWIVFLLVLAGCSSDGGSSKGSGEVPICGNVSDFTVAQNNENIEVNLVSSATPLFYELSVLDTAFNQIGPHHIMNSLHETFSLADLGLAPGNTYIFRVRTACEVENYSDWSPSKSLVIADFCYKPTDLHMDDHSLVWSYSGTATQFQVEYGLNGFARGTGTTATVTSYDYPFVAMQEGQTYDFYVRASCGATLGWSDWAGPYTYFCPANYNDCNIPSNIGYTIQRNFFNQATGANISWNFNGETQFEYTIVGATQPVTAGVINTSGQNPSIYYGLNQNTNYHFYVRAICRNGNRTPWAGPVLINIGS